MPGSSSLDVLPSLPSSYDIDIMLCIASCPYFPFQHQILSVRLEIRITPSLHCWLIYIVMIISQCPQRHVSLQLFHQDQMLQIINLSISQVAVPVSGNILSIKLAGCSVSSRANSAGRWLCFV